jgi:hypothetical protein
MTDDVRTLPKTEYWEPSASDSFCVVAGAFFIVVGAYLAVGLPGVIVGLGLCTFLFGIACDLRRAILEKANG